MDRTPQLVDFRAEGEGTSPVVRAAVLILPGGFVKSRGRYWPFIDRELRTLARLLAARGTACSLSVHLLRYRHRGWNGDRADPVVDTLWALERLGERHDQVPVVLVGNSM